MSMQGARDLGLGGDLAVAGDQGPLVDLAGADLSCGGDGARCTTASGGLGLCNAANGICACGGASADGDCNAAYGSTGNPYVCVGGACVPGSCSTSAACAAGLQCVAANCAPCSGSGAGDTCKSDPVYGNAYECVNGFCVVGNCRKDSDCTAGGGGNTQICLDNVCTPCTSDAQCQTDTDASGSAGPTSLCNTGNGGVCVKNVTCTVAGSGIAAEEAACAAYNNGNDICCGGTCRSGAPDPNHATNCCPASANDCSGTPMTTCTANGTGAGVCTKCPAPVANGSGVVTYYVDPLHGSDQSGTGDSTQVGCGFATITRALQVVGGSPANGVVILVSSDSTTLSASEVYPLDVPANVTVTTQANNGAGDITINVPASQSINNMTVPTAAAFVFGGKSAALSNFTINGGNAVPRAIDVLGYTPPANQAVTLSDVVVSGFTSEGIRVQAPTAPPANPQLVISGGNKGTHVDKNGNDAIAANGLVVLGYAAVTETDTGKRVTFSGNGANGIVVQRTGQLTLTGSSGTTAPTASTAIVLANNKGAGLFVNQTPGSSAAGPPANVVKGVTITGSGTGPAGVTFNTFTAHGLRVTGGSSLTLHTSLIYGNVKGSGIRVEDYHGTTGMTVSDLSHISFGSSGSPGADAGNNTLQGNGGTLARNSGSGVCLSIAGNLGLSLKAQGNTFGATDCTTSTAKLAAGKSCFFGSTDYAVSGPQSNAPNSVDVTMCR